MRETLERVLNEVERERIDAHRELRDRRQSLQQRMDRLGRKALTCQRLLSAADGVDDALDRLRDHDVPDQAVDERRRDALADLRAETMPEIVDEIWGDLDTTYAPDLDGSWDSVDDLRDALKAKESKWQEQATNLHQREQDALDDLEDDVETIDREWDVHARQADAAGIDLAGYWTPDDPLPEPEEE